MHKTLPAYLINWNKNIYTIITQGVQLIYIYSELNMNLPKDVLDITSHVINNTLKIVTEKIGTHSLQGFANYAKTYYYKNMKI